jgi:ectoine hydroxylase-related dioxygenase (phytanoyl-CoA dioxygenase family)
LGRVAESEYHEIQSKLEKDGYYVLENRLSAQYCEKLEAKLSDLSYQIRGDKLKPEELARLYKYDRSNIIAPHYVLERNAVTSLSEVQELISDPVLIRIAQSYLRSQAIFTGLTLDWTPPLGGVKDDAAAQLYHWDMERIKWIRFFIYLTDVDHESGPHCFVKGTHLSGSIPRNLINRGYARISDEEVLNVFGATRILEFVGKKGTIVIEDSRGLHKGLGAISKERLLMAFELSNSTFGNNKRHTITKIHSPRFRDLIAAYPRLYSNFDFNEV